jgi:hypothetical protein
MQPIVALEDRAAHVQHGLDAHHKDWIAALDQLVDAGFVGTSGDGSDEQPIGPQRTTNMVFEVDQLAFEQLPVGQQCAHLRDAARIVAVGLVAHCRQRNAHMARFDDNDC